MKKYGRMLLCLLMVAFSATPVLAQAIVGKEGYLFWRNDIDSATLTYCRMNGVNDDVFGEPIQRTQLIKTAGVSATVTEFTASSGPFSAVSVGDVLVIKTPTSLDPEHRDTRAVIAKASAASITVDSTIDLSAAGGFSFGFYKIQCGTSDNDGWVNVAAVAAPQVTIGFQYDAGDATAIVARWECKYNGLDSAPVILYPGKTSECGFGTLSTDRCSFATPGILSRLSVNDDNSTFTYCRLGVAFTGADASDVGANRESVTAKIIVRPSHP